MSLTLDAVALGVPQAEAARDFYASAFSADRVDSGTAAVDLHGTGRLAFYQIEALAAEVGVSPATSGFRGYVLGSIVSQPGDVKALLQSAEDAGAAVVKPAKKQLFGEFTASYQAPDGAVWKLAASSKKDTSPVAEPPKPTESAIYLGAASPKSSKAFYEALGMSAEHDYGDKFVDFHITAGNLRIGLLPRKDLAKDVGVDERGDGFAAVVLTHAAASPDEVDALLSAAAAAGARVTAAAESDNGDHAGYFTDPDGYYWNVTCAAL